MIWTGHDLPPRCFHCGDRFPHDETECSARALWCSQARAKSGLCASHLLEEVAAELLAGCTLSSKDVIAVKGLVMVFKGALGEPVIEDADAFDAATAFVALVGEDEALDALSRRK